MIQFSSCLHREFYISDEVLICREKTVGKLLGPYTIKNIDNEGINLDTGVLYIRASKDKLNQYTDDYNRRNQCSKLTTEIFLGHIYS